MMLVGTKKQSWHVLRRTHWLASKRWLGTVAPKPLGDYDVLEIEHSLGNNVALDPSRKQHLRTHKSNRNFSMVIPPPNVTGQLHLGHALTVSIQDSLARWRRMCGDNVVWIPGLDHAGIATQSVVEKRLMRSSQQTRYDLGREKFVQVAMDWHDEFSSKIVNQLHRLGTSLDWDRYVYTLDDRRSAAVLEAFVRLHEKGLIYRRPRLINWCPHLRTVISDLEVEHEEVTGPSVLKLPGGKTVTVGVMDSFAYPVEALGQGEKQEYLEVSTTRLETMLGDEAVVVHPEDQRYLHLHGRHVLHPIHGRRLPIICDSELVDPELGTGAVKITPAHDANDYACAVRHNIRLDRAILADDATINDSCESPEYTGLGRFEAREQLRLELERLGLYRGQADHEMSIARCSRSGDIIEPMLKEQWYVDCQTMGKRALALSEAGKVDFLPPHHRADWARWLENIQDWCVSRQLWWGHRIPAYRVQSPLLDDVQDEVWVVARSMEEARHEGVKSVARLTGVPVEQVTQVDLFQDEDVLDTWFSSALFPLSALGWPTGAGRGGFDEGMEAHYPLTLMETGSDILFFWVARMVMMCTELCPPTCEVPAPEDHVPPFGTVVLHPMVRDKDGRKMSKSLGNVIDPMHISEGVSLQELLAPLASGNLDPREVKLATKQLTAQFPEGIPTLGTDAMRLGLISYLQQGRQINLDLSRIEYWSYFCKKLWNAQKFVDGRLERHQSARFGSDFQMDDTVQTDLSRRWVLHRLWHTATEYEKAMEQYELFDALDKVERFFIDDFCGVYLEASKRPSVSDQQATAETLAFVLDCTLRMVHPFAPFLTEYLWRRWNGSQVESIGLAQFPTGRFLEEFQDPVAIEAMEAVDQVAYGLRALRPLAARLVDISGTAPMVIVSEKASTMQQQACFDHSDVVRHMSWMPSVEVVMESDASLSSSCLTKVVLDGSVTVSIPIEVENDETRVKVKKELLGLEKRGKKYQTSMKKVEQKLSNEKFIANAPAHVVEKERQSLAKAQASFDAIQGDIEGLARILNS